MNSVLAIDPGPEESAYVTLRWDDMRIIAFNKLPNDAILSMLLNAQEILHRRREEIGSQQELLAVLSGQPCKDASKAKRAMEEASFKTPEISHSESRESQGRAETMGEQQCGKDSEKTEEVASQEPGKAKDLRTEAQEDASETGAAKRLSQDLANDESRQREAILPQTENQNKTHRAYHRSSTGQTAPEAEGSMLLLPASNDKIPCGSQDAAFDGRKKHRKKHRDGVPELQSEQGENESVGIHEYHLVIEKISSFGMPVGAEVFETVFWSGRFAQAWGLNFHRIKRHEVKMHLCHNMRAKDGNIRQALIDKLGPQGVKKSPGPTYGISGDCWSALAVAVTFVESKSSVSAERHP